MIALRPAGERGQTALGWLDSRHSFSFGDYFDPRHMGFGSLRVINDDRVAPGGGFGTHPHHDMEIITLVLDGTLQHRDSLGNGADITPGEVQRMTAGTGIRHSEFNPSADAPVHLLQIWIVPEQKGLTPSYEQRSYPEAERQGRWRRVAGRAGQDGAVAIHQDVDLYLTLLPPGQSVHHVLRPGRHAWVHLARGGARLNGQALTAGDGAALSEESTVELVATEEAEVLLFDLT